MDQLLYARHFLLLTGVSVVLAVMSTLHPTGSVSVQVALYGALHASAIVLCLREAKSRWRSALFITCAAGLSLLALQAGIVTRHWSAALPRNGGLYAALGFSALIGAFTYGMLIRLLKITTLSFGAIIAIASCCALSSFMALFTVQHSHLLGPWWFAVVWWFTFSAGLWYCDRRRTAANQGPAGERTCSGRTPRPMI